MRLYNYLNEDISDQELSKLIPYMEKECKTFINTLKNLNGSHLIFSGRKENDPFIVKKVRKQRNPRDTPMIIHQLLNQYFEEHIGIRLRSETIFTTPNVLLAEDYGEPYAIFPMGKYQLWYNPELHDLLDKINGEIKKIIREKTGETMNTKDFMKKYSIEQGEGKEIWENFKEKLEEIVKGYRRGFPTKNEPREWMLHCDSYIGVKVENLKKVLERLDLLDSVKGTDAGEMI